MNVEAFEPEADGDEWVDWVVVHRAVTGREPVGRRLTRAEKREAARRLLAQGLTPTAITRHLRISGDTLTRVLGEAS